MSNYAVNYETICSEVLNMGFIDNISKGAKTFAEKAVKKTGEVAESAKLVITLKSEEIKLDGLFEELGRLCYEKADQAMIAAQVLEIDEQKSIISQIKAEIAANSGRAICEECGKEIPTEAAFCSYCGKKQGQKKNIEKEPTSVTKEEPTSSSSDKTVVKTEACCVKPLGCEEFIEFFKATMLKYGFAK